MDQILKPPYTKSDLELFARRQLGQHPVPQGYIKQLQFHLKYFKHDHLFRLTPHGGDGYGVIDCLEPGCGVKNIILQPRTTVPDGGRSIGIGGLAAFQSHIVDDDNHEQLRNRRLRKEAPEQNERHRQPSAAIPHGSATSTTKAVTSNALPMTLTQGMAEPSLSTQARVIAKDPASTMSQDGVTVKDLAITLSQDRVRAKDPATTQPTARGIAKTSLRTQARVPSKNPVTAQAQARGMAKASLSTQARVPAKDLIKSQTLAPGTAKASLPTQARVSSKDPAMAQAQATGKALTLGANRRTSIAQSRTSRQPALPSTISPAGSASTTSSKRPAPPLSEDSLIDTKKRKVQPEIVVLSKPKGLLPNTGVSAHSIVPQSIPSAPSQSNASKFSLDIIDIDSEPHEDLVWLDGEGLVPCSRLWPKEPSLPQPTSSSARGVDTVRHASSLPQSPNWAYSSTSKPMSNLGAPASRAYHNSQHPVFTSGSHSQAVPAPEVNQLLRWSTSLAAPQNHPATQLPPSSSMWNRPSISTSTASMPLALKGSSSKQSSKSNSRKTPVLNARKSIPLSTPQSALSHRYLKSSSSDIIPKALFSSDSNPPDLSIIPLELKPRKKDVSMFDPLNIFGGPEPIMTETERHQFFKSAADNSAFEHNTTIEKARVDLGITGNDPYMDGLAVKLLPHQLLGVSWMLKEEKGPHKGGILADEMGMGKTVQMIATIVKNPSRDPKIKSTLIVAPLALLTQWEEEIKARSTGDFKILLYHSSHSKPSSKKLIANHDIVITTLATLWREWYDEERTGKKLLAEGIEDDENISPNKRMGPLFKVDWYRVVIDEAQNIRNPRALGSRAVCGLRATFRWCLTGTPIFNSLWDIFPLLRLLRVRPYHDRTQFSQHIARNEKKRPDLAATRTQAVLLTCMLRRLKHAKLDGKLLLTLPHKSTEDRMLNMSAEEREVYDMVEKQMQAKFNKFLKRGTVLKNYANVFVMLLRLRQACGHPSLVTEDSGDAFEEPAVDRAALQDASSELARAQSKMGQEWVDKVKKKFQDEAAELVEAEKNDPTSASVPECPICNDALEDSARITKCTHVFCEGCIDQVIEHIDPGNVADEPANPDMVTRPCPNCRAPFSRIDTFLRKAFLPPREDYDDDDDDDADLPDTSFLDGRKRQNVVDDSDAESSSSPSQKGKGKSVDPPTPTFPASTKMVWLLEELERVKAKNPDDKMIIISQWTSMLALVSTFLSQNGYRHVLYQGDMRILQRNDAVLTFLKDRHVPILLMSLKCGGVGLNLTVANRVISLDLAWSPATEAQAFDRVHRVGQTKDVFINRVIINNTVEQRICELQRAKQNIADSALGEGTGKKLQRMTVSELTTLFNLDSHGNRMNQIMSL